MQREQEAQVVRKLGPDLREAAADHLQAAYALLRRSDRPFAAYLVQLALAAIREEDRRH